MINRSFISNTVAIVFLPVLFFNLLSCDKTHRPTNINQGDTSMISRLYRAGTNAVDSGHEAEAGRNFYAGISASRKNDQRLYEGFGLAHLTTFYRNSGQYDSASRTGKLALDIFRSEHYNGRMYLMTRLALLEQHEQNSDYLQLTSEGLDILKQARDQHDTPAIARTLVLLSRASPEPASDKKSLAYQEEAVSLLRQSSDKSTLPKTLNNLALVYIASGRNEEALVFCREALQHEKPALRVDGYTYCYMAFAYIGLGETDSAFMFLNKSKAIAGQLNDPRMELNVYSASADLYADLGNYQKAIEMFDTGLVLMKQSGISTLLPGFYLGKAKAFKKMGEFEKSLAAYNTADSVLVIIREGDVNKKIAELETKYKTREKEASITMLSRTATLQRNGLIIVIALLVLAVTLGILSLIQYRRQKNANKVISIQAEKMQWLMKEIHHRVKNNLQVISSIINLHLRRIKDERALGALGDTRNKIMSISMIHQNLYQSKGMELIEMQDYLEQLVRNMNDVLAGQGEIVTKVDGGGLSLDIDTAVPLALIITELMANSWKHGREEGTTLVISIALGTADSGFYLDYLDNGPGLPENWQRNIRKSLGMDMVMMMIDQLDGTLKSENQEGANFHISFLNSEQRKKIA